MDEKERIVILGLVEVILMLIFYSVVDPVLGGGVPVYFQESGEQARYLEPQDIWAYWKLMPLIYGLIAIGMAVGSLLGDYGTWTDEDYYGALLLLLTPYWLVFIGFLDHVSESFIEYGWSGVFAKGFPWTSFEWWWLDKWSLPYYISKLFGFEHTQGFTIFIGYGIGIPILVGLWVVYYECA